MKKFKFVLISIFLILMLMSFSQTIYCSYFYGFTSLTGGITGSLDKIVNPSDNDMAIGIDTGIFYTYTFDSSCTSSTNSPNIIAPITGTGCWELVSVYKSVSSDSSSSADSATNCTTATTATSATSCVSANTLAAAFIDFNSSSGGSSILNKPDMSTYQPLLTNPLVAGTVNSGDLCTYAGTNSINCNTPTSTFQTALTNPVTGTGTAYYLAYWNGAGSLSKLSNLGTAGYVLTSNGAGLLPTWQAAGGNGGNVSMTYPDAGVAVSTGASWDTSIDPATLALAVTTVNGYPLSSNIDLGSNDIGLGNVTNDAQVVGIASSVEDNFISFGSNTGKLAKDSGYSAASFAPAYTSTTANFFLASPSGSSGVPTFRAIVSEDLPSTIGANTTGTASNLSGTPTLPNGVKATTQSSGDNSTNIATTAYVDSSVSFLSGYFVPNVTGFSCSTGGRINWLKVSNNVFLSFDNAWQCTSNSSTFTITNLPSSIWPTHNQYAKIYIEDNGSESYGYVGIVYGGTMTFGKSWGTAGGFTSSGNKGIIKAQTIMYSLQ